MAHKPLSVSQVRRVEPHPGADRLDLVETEKGVVCAQRGLFKLGQDVLHLEPDRLVKAGSELAAGMHNPKVRPDGYIRVRCVKLRGIWSDGFLAPLDPNYCDLEDLAELLDVGWYDPEEDVIDGGHGRGQKAPSYPGPEVPKYDLERLGKDARIEPGTPCWATVKIHGANARYTFHNGELLCGSRGRWLDPAQPTTAWHRALTPGMEQFCRDNVGIVLFGEIYGPGVQGPAFAYDATDVKFRAFDVWYTNGKQAHFLQHAEAYDIPLVPLVFAGNFDAAALLALAGEEDAWARPGQMREGLVIETAAGKCKLVSKKYLGRE